MANDPNTPSASVPGAPPTTAALNALAQAFLNISTHNHALRTQAPIRKVPIAGLEKANASLTTAKAHAAQWDNVLSGEVQNTLQLIKSYNVTYQSLMPDLEEIIGDLQKSTATAHPSPDEIKGLVSTLQALQESLRLFYQGTGGTVDAPTKPSALYANQQMAAYKTDVIGDYTTFEGYTKLVTGAGNPLSADITKWRNAIASAVRSQGYDTDRQLAGSGIAGAGLIIGIAAVVMAPETGGASMVVAGMGVGVAAGGTGVAVAMAITNQQDYDAQAKIISDDTGKLKADVAEQLVLPSVGKACKGVVKHTDAVVTGIGTIITSWHQLDNALGDFIAAFSLPEKDLATWITNHPQYKADSKWPYKSLGNVLHAHLAAPKQDWQDASDYADKLLSAMASAKKVEIPAGTPATQAAIVAAMNA